MNLMLIGGIATGSIVAAFFFLRFWRRTGDRFFLYFAGSFFLEGINRFALGMSSHPDEGKPSVYLIRFISFCLILIAIVEKNLARSPRRSSAAREITKSIK